MIGDRERGMDMIAVGDCSVDLGVLGVVNELSVHDGTGVGSAQRVDVEVGVCRSDGTIIILIPV